MVELPENLQQYEQQAKSLLNRGMVGAIEFSGSTYQVEVRDPKTGEEIWAFLQFDAKGILEDSFCSCAGSKDISSCGHIAAAYLRIYGTHSQPLHVRFENSLW